MYESVLHLRNHVLPDQLTFMCTHEVDFGCDDL